MSPAVKRFIRHYAEMVAAMLLGMVVLGAPAEWVMGLAAGTGWHELSEDAPAAMLLLMAVTMTVPMVAWMRYRGHGRRASAEMSASMFLPAFAATALLGLKLVEDVGTLLAVEHVAMLLSMLGAMLLRPSEYTQHHRHHRHHRHRVAA